jgi:hypothetical protein
MKEALVLEKRNDGERGSQKHQILRDVIYGRPLKSTKSETNVIFSQTNVIYFLLALTQWFPNFSVARTT